MNILITGGNGVIGKQLAQELIRRGHWVMSIDLVHREDEYAFGIDHYFLRTKTSGYMRCDVSEFGQLKRIFETCPDFDFVYHTAAEFGRWNGEDFYETLWRTNVIGTKHLIRLQNERGFNLVHFSSSEVYGDWPTIMVETVMENHEIKQLNDYAMTKWVNEMQIRNAAMLHVQPLKSVIVRLFNTYGPGEYYSPYRSVNCRFLYSALTGKPWTVFRGHRRTSTFLPDTVRTLSNITDNFKRGETYNIGGDVEHTIEELSDAVLAVTGADPKLVRYADSEPMTTRVKHVDCTKAIRDLGHKNTVGLKEGLALTADWMRKVYSL